MCLFCLVISLGQHPSPPPPPHPKCWVVQFVFLGLLVLLLGKSSPSLIRLLCALMTVCRVWLTSSMYSSLSWVSATVIKHIKAWISLSDSLIFWYRPHRIWKNYKYNNSMTMEVTVIAWTQQRLFFLRKSKRSGLSSWLLVNFYSTTIESILCHIITVWKGSCTSQEEHGLRGGNRSTVTYLDSVYAGQNQKARCIATDKTHPSNELFILLPSGKRYRTTQTCTSRLRDSFFSRAVKFI